MNSNHLLDQINELQGCYCPRRSFLTEYFSHIFSQLCKFDSLAKENTWSFEMLNAYLNLPLIITRRIFREFSLNQQFLFKQNFVDGMLDLYFGSVEKILYLYFSFFKMDEKEVLNLQDVLLAVRYLTSNKDKILSFENMIKKFEKNCQTNLVNFSDFKTFILYEDPRLLIDFIKLIYENKPFTVNSIEYFIKQTDEFQVMNESFSSTDEFLSKSTLESDSSKLMPILEENTFKFYEVFQKRFRKTKLIVIDNNFFLHTNRIHNEEFTFEYCIPTSVFFHVIGKLNVKLRKLTCIDLHLKYSKNETPCYLRIFSKSEDDLRKFMKAAKFPDDIFSFLSDYKILNQIGEGQFGSVYLIQNNISKEFYSLKKIKKSESCGKNLLLNELETLKFLKMNPHENIIKVIDFFEDVNYIYIIMEYLTTSLDSILQEKNLNDEGKSIIVKKIANGIHFLHSNGIVHRDLKPENILVERVGKDDYSVKLIDFGFSKALYINEFISNEPYGTLAFVAPEVMNKTSYNYKVDVWSFGVIVYLIYFNVLPLKNIDSSINMIEIARNLAEFSKNLKFQGNVITEILNGCFQIDPTKRLNMKEISILKNSMSP